MPEETNPLPDETQPGSASSAPNPVQSGNTISELPRKIYPIQPAWLGFIKSVQPLLAPQVDNRPLDQYLALRDKVFEMAQREQFLKSLNNSWALFTEPPKKEFAEVLILELEAFPRAVEVANTTEKPDDAKKRLKLLGQASTITGSVKDFLDTIPEVKMMLMLFKEVLDFFKQ